MSAAVAGSVGAISMRRHRSSHHVGTQSFEHKKDPVFEKEKETYFEQTYIRHVTYMIFLQRMINDDYDNSFLQSLAEDIFNENIASKVLDLDDISPTILFILSDDIKELIVEIDRFVLSTSCFREKFDDLVAAIANQQRRKAESNTESLDQIQG
jgi:hypothetical protein